MHGPLRFALALAQLGLIFGGANNVNVFAVSIDPAIVHKGDALTASTAERWLINTAEFLVDQVAQVQDVKGQDTFALREKRRCWKK